MLSKTLSNGVVMPMLGYGTLRIAPEDAEACVTNALEVGYRLIDTASTYLNEKEIGQAIKKSKIAREELFLTSKVWIQDSGYKHTMKAFQLSLERLGVTYLDLYLIHQPYGDYYGSWRAMETLYRQGKIRAIGVCNFQAERFVDLCLNCSIPPMINQIEFHPFFQQKETYGVLQAYQCQLEAWGPFNEGLRDIFHHPCLQELAQKHNRSVAQIMLRWHIQNDVIAIPKTIHIDKMIENMDIWDFALEEEDMKKVKEMDIGHSEIINHQCYMTTQWLHKYKLHEEWSEMNEEV